jgi:nicotinamidase-related amidase
MAANLGFRVTVVSDATATFERTGPDGTRYDADVMHRVALASLHGEFAEVLESAAVLQAWAPLPLAARSKTDAS